MTGETKYPFIDTAFAAEMMGVPQSQILEWIAEGKLKSYGGKERNPFIRSADVEMLASELGRTLSTKKESRAAQNPVRRIQLRLRADARWNEVSETDIAEWARETDLSSRAAAAKVARAAIERLSALLAAVNEKD